MSSVTRSVRVCAFALILVCGTRTAEGAFITNSFGLTTPDTTITFGEVPLADTTPLTTQFSAFGVTFSNLFIDNTFVINPPVADNFNYLLGCPSGGCPSFDIFFTADVNAAAFQLLSNFGTTTFQAFLNGALVETATALTGQSLPIPYYSFTGIVFDQIRVTPVGANTIAGQATIDNIEFDLAPTTVPEPASIFLVGTGVAGIGVRRWRRRRLPNQFPKRHRSFGVGHCHQ